MSHPSTPTRKRNREQPEKAPKPKTSPCKSPFYLRAKFIFGTYPKCAVTKKSALEQHKLALDIDYYVVCEEKHDDGTPHLHMWYALTKACQILDTRKTLSLEDTVNGGLHNGHWEACRSNRKCKAYCEKGGVYITNQDWNIMRAAVVAAQAGQRDEAFQMVVRADPRMALTRAAQLKDSISVLAAQEKKSDGTEYTVFINVPVQMTKWNRKVHALWLEGPSGYGKTEFALSQFKNPLMVRHLDILKKLKDDHDGVVFDDLNMQGWPREECIHLCDLKHDSGTNVKHGCVTLPRGLARIFTSNSWIWPADPYGAIARRVKGIRIRDKLFDEADQDEEDTKGEDDWAEMESEQYVE